MYVWVVLECRDLGENSWWPIAVLDSDERARELKKEWSEKYPERTLDFTKLEMNKIQNKK